MNRSRSRLTLVVGPLLIISAMGLPFILFWTDLPNPMASHWGLTGVPNGSMPPLVLLLVVGGIFVTMWWAVTRAVSRVPEEAPSFVAGLFGVGGLLAAVAWASVSVNRDVVSWEDADGFGVLQLLVVVLVAAGAGLMGWLLAGPVAERSRKATVPILDVDRSANVVWSSRGSGRLPALVGVIVIVIGLVLWGWTTLILILLGLLVLAFAEVRATVSSRGVVVSLGWLGEPSWTVPLASIVQAEVETVFPMSYGGWGYRIRPGVRAIVTRSGEGLRLVRADKADLVLTVDDAETGAGLINTMLGVSAS